MSSATDARPRTSARVLAIALVMRLVLFAGFQALIALVLLWAGVAQPWSASAAWWPISAAATGAVTFAFLWRRSRVEGFSMWAFYRPTRSGMGKDVLLALAVAAVGGGLAVAGTILLAPLFFADPLEGSALLFQPLPLWAAIVALVVFPISIALTELPLYFGYVQPRLAVRAGAVIAFLLPAIALAAQHATLPLIFDEGFILWRALMFLGFALVLSAALWKRPSLLPYLIVVHFALDLQAAVSVLLASQ